MNTRLSPTEFWIQYGYKPFELVEGVVIQKPKLRMVESVVLLRITALIEQFTAENDLGEVVSGIGFSLGRNTIRTPHTAFIAKSLWESVRLPYSPFSFAPSLVIETAPSVEPAFASANPYLAAGTAQVWLINTQTQQVTVQMAQGAAQEYNLGDTISGGRVLPGLVLPVASLFPRSRHL